MEQDYLKASDGTGEAALATIQTNRSVVATVIEVDTLDNWPDEFIVVTGTLDANGYITPASMTQMLAHQDSGDIIIDGFVPGYTDVGNTADQVAIIKQNTYWADRVVERLAPAGAVLDYAGSTVPTGWLECDGSAISRTTYADLFAAIGTTWGDGDGSTTFNLPNAAGRSRIGAGTGGFTFEFDDGDVDTGTDEITVTANPELITGKVVQLSTTGTLPTGLSASTDYYIIVVDSTTIQLATSLANAVAGTQINITGAGSGTFVATGTLTARTLGETGGEEAHAQTEAELATHTHTQNSHNHQERVATGGGSGTGITGTANLVGNTGSNQSTASATATSQDTGDNDAFNVMGPFGVYKAIIKT